VPSTQRMDGVLILLCKAWIACNVGDESECQDE
jgi:hypothetical protein